MRSPNGKEQRESIWSVTRREQAVYFGIFTLLASTGMIYLLWYEIQVGRQTNVAYLVRFIFTNAGTIGIGAASTALATTEVPKLIMVVARYLDEQYLQPRLEKKRKERELLFVKGVEEAVEKAVQEATKEARQKALEEGREEGRRQAFEEARQETHQLWMEWLQRQDEAIAKGQPFKEPPLGNQEPL